MIRHSFSMIALSLLLAGCGGGSSDEGQDSGLAMQGTLQADKHLFDPAAMARISRPHNFADLLAQGEQGPADLATWHVCGDRYNREVPEARWNLDTDGDLKPDLNLTDDDGNLYYNIDLDNDGWADINLLTYNEGIHLNVDTNCDAKADVNIDLNFDYKADLNIDVDGDMVADRLIDIDGDGQPDFSFTNTGGVLLSGVPVKLTGKYGEFEAVTDENGRFEFERIPTGEYRLEADALAIDGSKIWTRTQITLDEFNDSIGAFRMHQDPIITQIEVDGEAQETLTQQANAWPDHEYSIGDSVTLAIVVEDPNQRPLQAYNEPDFQSPELLPGNNGRFEMTYQITEADAQSEAKGIQFFYFNDDGFMGFDGMVDGRAYFSLPMADYVEAEPLTIKRVMVGDEVFENVDQPSYFLVEPETPVAVDAKLWLRVEVEGPADRQSYFSYMGLNHDNITSDSDEILFDGTLATPRYIYKVQYSTWTDGIPNGESAEIWLKLDTDKQPATLQSLLINGADSKDLMGRVGQTLVLEPVINNPNGDEVSCKFERHGNFGPGADNGLISDWGACQATYTLVQADAVDMFNFSISVRNEDGILSEHWDYDDSRGFDVSVTQ
ncbi:carboxypeptidase-like regulatory domain-containing protein [Ferrimonas balearica]|uniref:carboxypeptidase-like regulatory domain-containing protein n=1 Tax=Ferrimonas balearica TaxID=44012 RepID=UPI001C592A78|nr:carboxypeptidase-like regulatory domain-containing protein [Ferrimonas balearica]MBW3138360.1 carboxypeptidase-like regulatory domain-containing protein [Ferrimonas balearica]